MELLEGWRWRDERLWEKCAWAVAYMLQPWSKRTVQPAELLGRPVTNPEEANQLLDPQGALDDAVQTMLQKQAALREKAIADGADRNS